MSETVTYKYIVFVANNTTKTYLEVDSLGITLFNEGRALNCKKLTEAIESESGLYFSTTTYALIAPRSDNSEYEDVMGAGLDLVEEFENADLFLEKYST